MLQTLIAIATLIVAVLVLVAIAKTRTARKAGDDAKVKTWRTTMFGLVGLLAIGIVATSTLR